MHEALGSIPRTEKIKNKNKAYAAFWSSALKDGEDSGE
jgi:hypothetical protein